MEEQNQKFVKTYSMTHQNNGNMGCSFLNNDNESIDVPSLKYVRGYNDFISISSSSKNNDSKNANSSSSDDGDDADDEDYINKDKNDDATSNSDATNDLFSVSGSSICSFVSNIDNNGNNKIDTKKEEEENNLNIQHIDELLMLMESEALPLSDQHIQVGEYNTNESTKSQQSKNTVKSLQEEKIIPSPTKSLYTLEQMQYNTILDQQWKRMFRRLKKYKRQNGNCCVPSRYRRDKSLNNWVKLQRQSYHENTLREDRLHQLESIGFEFWLQNDTNLFYGKTWDEMFKRLQIFKRQFGNCFVPYKYAFDKSLGRWVDDQRQIFEMKKMRKDRQDRLESIGFVWNGSMQKKES